VEIVADYAKSQMINITNKVVSTSAKHSFISFDDGAAIELNTEVCCNEKVLLSLGRAMDCQKCENAQATKVFN